MPGAALMSDRSRDSADIIDVHAHVYPQGCVRDIIGSRTEFGLIDSRRGGMQLTYRGSFVMSIPPAQDDLGARLAKMDEAGIALQVLSIGALNIGWAGERAVSAARSINNALAEVCGQARNRLRFVATLPFESRAEMVKELERALSLGAVGVGITTTVGDSSLDSPKLTDFWHEASERNLVVLVHPTYPPNGPSGDQGQFLMAGYLGETAMAATRLVLAGVLEECPGVRLVWSHLGGTLAMMIDRLDRAYKRYERCRRAPSSYLRECFYDTACTHGPALDCARATFGAGALLFGTDEPHVPDASRDVLAALRARPWPTSDLEAVLTGNAQRLGLS